MRIPRLLAAVAALCITSPCLAQYTLKRIVFHGTTSYTQQQLEQVVEMRKGMHFGTKEMGDAAQRLMDTGAFKDITSSVDGPIAGIDLIFDLKAEDAATFLPARYINLVWFTDAEREAGLKERVPLFNGRIPRNGTMEQQVQAALVAMLAAKGVTATVDAGQIESTAVRATPEFDFRVTSPAVLVGEINLSGLAPQFTEKDQESLHKLTGSPYMLGSEAELTDRLLTPLRNTGYINAKIDSLQLTPAASTDGSVRVAIAGNVLAGDLYHISGVQWQGSSIFSAADFGRTLQTVKLQPGDVASQLALMQGYAAITNAYLAHGYMDVKVQALPSRDDAAHTVGYTIQVTPGEVYHVGSVTVVGLDPQTRVEFDASWKLKPGEVYDESYTRRFLGKEAPASVQQRYSPTYNAVADPNKHTVDLTFTFKPTR